MVAIKSLAASAIALFSFLATVNAAPAPAPVPEPAADIEARNGVSISVDLHGTNWKDGVHIEIDGMCLDTPYYFKNYYGNFYNYKYFEVTEHGTKGNYYCALYDSHGNKFAQSNMNDGYGHQYFDYNKCPEYIKCQCY